jgi:hypothetical protein
MNKKLILTLTLIASIAFIPIASAREGWTRDTDNMDTGHYHSVCYYNNAKTMEVWKGLCLEDNSAVSDNNYYMNDNIKMVDHQEFTGDLTQPSVAVHYNKNREAVKVRHKVNQEKISMMRQINLLKQLIKNL